LPTVISNSTVNLASPFHDRHHLLNMPQRNLIPGPAWRVMKLAGDEEWPLTDHPVLTLNYYGRGQV
jgi:hypothetical protein